MGVALLAAAQERGASWPSDVDLWLLFWLLCAVAYAILVLVQRQNRTRAGLKTAVVWYLAAEFVNSMGWGLYCYLLRPASGEFSGLRLICGLPVWAVLLFAALVLTTRQNRRAASKHS